MICVCVYIARKISCHLCRYCYWRFEHIYDLY